MKVCDSCKKEIETDYYECIPEYKITLINAVKNHRHICFECMDKLMEVKK